jgi:hypothetical protein
MGGNGQILNGPLGTPARTFCLPLTRLIIRCKVWSQVHLGADMSTIITMQINILCKESLRICRIQQTCLACWENHIYRAPWFSQLIRARSACRVDGHGLDWECQYPHLLEMHTKSLRKQACNMGNPEIDLESRSCNNTRCSAPAARECHQMCTLAMQLSTSCVHEQNVTRNPFL